MDVPIIRVEDWEQEPPVATRYLCGDNELDLETIWVAVNGLLDHDGRGQFEVAVLPSLAGMEFKRFRMRQCSPEFLDAFWSCMAKLLDYFADFFVHDAVLMQSMWFHLLDVVQEAADLPHKFWDPEILSCTHARQFARDYDHTLRLINKVIAPNESRVASRRVRPNVDVLQPTDVCLGFKAGLKPWQQYLFAAAPGFDVPEQERIYTHLQVTNGPGQCLPVGALAIIERHTAHARMLTSKVARRISDDRSEAEMLSEFDQHAIKIDDKPFTYTSIDGREKTAQMMHPNPEYRKAPRRYLGLGDASCIVSHPNLELLDESLAYHRGIRGIEGYGHPDGSSKFHMMAVHSSSPGKQDAEPVINQQKHFKMFDDWTETKNEAG